MAFRFGDPGGRMYNAVGSSQINLLALWTGASSNAGNFSITTSGGRTVGNCLTVNTGSGSFISKTLDAQATWGIAFAIKVTTITASGSQIWAIQDAGSTQCDLRINSNGTLFVTRAGTTLGTTTTAIPMNTWVHVEWKTLINNTTGTTEVRINGASAGLSLTSQNTRATANNSANAIILGNSGFSSMAFNLDDAIVYDGQTVDAAGNADIHDFIGDSSATWLLPAGAGASSQFTPDSGTNYTRVNEATPDGDTSYVQDSTVNDIDLYTLAALASGATVVKSLAVYHYARKTDSGSRTMEAEIRTGSTNYSYANAIALATSYIYYASGWGTNPNTASPWTVSDVNGMQAGQTVSA